MARNGSSSRPAFGRFIPLPGLGTEQPPPASPIYKAMNGRTYCVNMPDEGPIPNAIRQPVSNHGANAVEAGGPNLNASGGNNTTDDEDSISRGLVALKKVPRPTVRTRKRQNSAASLSAADGVLVPGGKQHLPGPQGRGEDVLPEHHELSNKRNFDHHDVLVQASLPSAEHVKDAMRELQKKKQKYETRRELHLWKKKARAAATKQPTVGPAKGPDGQDSGRDHRQPERAGFASMTAGKHSGARMP